MLANIDPEQRKPQLLVLAPTRELAIQVADVSGLCGFSQKIKVLQYTAVSRTTIKFASLNAAFKLWVHQAVSSTTCAKR